MVKFPHILVSFLMLWHAHQNIIYVLLLVFHCCDKLPFFPFLIFKLTQNNNSSPVILRSGWGQGRRLSAKMVSTWMESKVASWDKPSQHRGINGLPSWIVSSGSGTRVIWPWRCQACACVLSGPHSSIISYDIKYQHGDPIATAKAPDTTYCESMHLTDELELFMWQHLCFWWRVTHFKLH